MILVDRRQGRLGESGAEELKGEEFLSFTHGDFVDFHLDLFGG